MIISVAVSDENPESARSVSLFMKFLLRHGKINEQEKENLPEISRRDSRNGISEN